jgi:hypothetical protein
MGKKAPSRKSLFEPGENPSRDLYVHNRGDGWWMYADGYRLAAELLIAKTETLTLGECNALIYPVVFLYRHHLELRLKYIVLVGQRLRHESIAPPTHHRLDTLWGECKRVIRERSIAVASGDRRDIEEVIEELARLDPSSDLFRYPMNKTAAFPFPDELRQFNLSRLGTRLSKVSATLRHIAGMLDADLDLEMEFYDELYGAYE